MTQPWQAAIMQVPMFTVASAVDAAEAQVLRLARLDDYAALIRDTLAEQPANLVVMPEYALGQPEADLRGVADGKGPEMERLAEIARSNGIFLAASLYLDDERFPGRYFNTSVLFDENGAEAARYFRIFTYHSTSPHDFWQRFVDKVGLEGAFPVARTRLGNLAMLSSMELMFPELARIYMLRGAEVLLHLTAEIIVDLSVKRTRAVENMAYLLSANLSRGPTPPALEVASTIVDWRGLPIAAAPAVGDGICRAEIDIEELRAGRRAPSTTGTGMVAVNYLARLRTEIMRGHYEQLSVYPADTYVEGDVLTESITPEKHVDKLETAIANMARAGILPKV